MNGPSYTGAWKPGTYYEHLCKPGGRLLIPVQDVLNWEVAVPLGFKEIVYCDGFVTRATTLTGGRYVRYVRLLHRRDPAREDVVLYLPVTRNNKSRGHWRELNPMVVLARADELPAS